MAIRIQTLTTYQLKRVNDFLFSYGLTATGASITDQGQLNVGLDRGCAATIGEKTPIKLAKFCNDELDMNVRYISVDGKRYDVTV